MPPILTTGMSQTESALSGKAADPSARVSGWERAGKRFALALYILYCVEIGMFLLVVPWSEVWERNFLVAYVPLLRLLYLNHFFRGAVSGLGVINLWLGVSEAWHFRWSGSRAASGK